MSDRLAALLAELPRDDAARLVARAPEPRETLARAEALAAARPHERLAVMAARAAAPEDPARWSAERPGVRRLAAQLVRGPDALAPAPRGARLVRLLLLERLLSR